MAALGLADSPVGLAGWIIEKFRRWSDCDGEIENAFSKDELLTNVMLYWVTGTIASAFLPYYEVAHLGPMGLAGRVRDVPQGPLAPAARVGGAILQCAKLDRNAARRALCGA